MTEEIQIDFNETAMEFTNHFIIELKESCNANIVALTTSFITCYAMLSLQERKKLLENIGYLAKKVEGIAFEGPLELFEFLRVNK